MTRRKADCLNNIFHTCFNHNHVSLAGLDKDLDLTCIVPFVLPTELRREF